METQGFFPETQIQHHEAYVTVEEHIGCESFSARSLELGLLQPFLVSTILILSTKGVGSCPHKLAAAYHIVGS